MAFTIISVITYTFTILFLFPISATAQTNPNVTSGTFLLADVSNSSWLSPSGEFALGFHQVVQDGGYLLAIWYNSIPERTIVWSANRDNLTAQGSRIQLLQDGRFVLNDPSGRQIWAANSTGTTVAYGAMLDTGKFVLVSNRSRVVWQSFDMPTDTLLPGQSLNQGGRLIASLSETNYARGRFMMSMQTDGDVVWSVRNYPFDYNVSTYFGLATVGRGYRLELNQSGYIHLFDINGTSITPLYQDSFSGSQNYKRVTLDYDGVLRNYAYPRFPNSTNGREMRWVVANFLPENICDGVYSTIGSGACGYNSICSLGADQRPHCSCPQGYSRVDPNDRMSACKKDFAPQSCDPNSNESALFTFTEMVNTDWPFQEYESYEPTTEDWCRQTCLVDCFCDVILYINNRCLKKRFPLSNGGANSNGILLIKRRRDMNGTRNDTFSTQQNSKHQSSTLITISSLSGSLAVLTFLLISSLMYFICYRHRKASIHQESTVLPGMNIRSFSFTELQEATDGFKEELGRGACSTVYKGVLHYEDGKLIAVKKLDKIAEKAEIEFKAEVNSISRTNHKNLVKLLGYCDEGQNKLLVYEFMSNGSLSSFLFGNSRPSWYKRIQIASAIARGISYLHEECCTQIIHCDIKPENVLLDETLTAKISDFGLAKLLMADQTRTNTGIRGTRGYVAPEWFRDVPITVKVDVYSFGILLLELICCRRKVEKDVENETLDILADWAYDCYKDRTVKMLVAGDEEAIYDIKRFEKYLMISLWCIQEDPTMRPNMKRVLHMLEESVDVPIPPDLDSFTSII